MTKIPTGPSKAYRNLAFPDGIDARPLRILAEHLEPQARFENAEVSDTIVFMWGRRASSPTMRRSTRWQRQCAAATASRQPKFAGHCALLR
jgi:hypothetical protein